MKNLCNQYLLLAKKETFAAIRKNRQQPFEDICNALQHIYGDIKIEYDTLSVKVTSKFKLSRCDFSIVWKEGDIVTQSIVSVETKELGNRGLEFLEDTCEKIFSATGSIAKTYHIVNLRDDVSEKYCNRIYPKFNEYERKLKRLLWIVYTANYGISFYKLLDQHIKTKSKKALKQSKEDALIQNMFYGLDLGDVEQLLFTPRWTDEDRIQFEIAVSEETDYNGLSDAEIKDRIRALRPRSDWDRLFSDLFSDDLLMCEENIVHIRKLRNCVAHCRKFSSNDFKASRKILNELIARIDTTIEVLFHTSTGQSSSNDEVIDAQGTVKVPAVMGGLIDFDVSKIAAAIEMAMNDRGTGFKGF